MTAIAPYPPAGQKVFRSFSQKYGKQPDAYALYGFGVLRDRVLTGEDAADRAVDIGSAAFQP